MCPEKIDFIYHEMTMFRLERRARRLWVSAIVLFLVTVVSNLAWVVHFMF